MGLLIWASLKRAAKVCESLLYLEVDLIWKCVIDDDDDDDDNLVGVLSLSKYLS